MQYPAGTNFQVVKTRLGSSGLPYRFKFKDGYYTILNIKKNGEMIAYAFGYNGRERVIVECNNCRDMDKIIAFCRNEKVIELIAPDEFEDQ
jgi:hypothetical protein